jgi:predicted phosphodiesterase
MKIIALGDIHGRTNWEKIVDNEMDSDKIIFIGDYFDSRDSISALEQIHNFKEIIKLKKIYPEKFIILFGNHIKVSMNSSDYFLVASIGPFASILLYSFFLKTAACIRKSII